MGRPLACRSAAGVHRRSTARAALLGLAVLLGAGVAPVGAGASSMPLPAPPVQPEPCPPPPLPPGPPAPPLRPPLVATSRVPLVASPPARRVDLAAITGKGIWLTLWPGSHPDLAAIVARARAAGIDQLWVRTGSTADGYYGGKVLAALVPLAHAAGVHVVAWDFPTLSDPRADAHRAEQALASGADAFSADIETAAEGTYLGVRRVRYYLSLVRRYAGPRPVVATVLPPGPYWSRAYPYAAMAPFVDAFAPMVYWSCAEPGAAVAQAVVPLRRLRPVVPIGQDFNMASIGGRHGLPSPAEIWRFLYVAHSLGAIGASLYDLESGGPAQFAALAAFPWATRSPGG